MEMAREIPPSRVFLWTVPRSVSTAFLKCMDKVPGVQIINELYLSAYGFGPERKNGFSAQEEEWHALYDKTAKERDIKFGNLIYDDNICTYAWVKEIMERDFQGKQLIFSKDHAVYLDGKFDHIPCGYKHTFLIRHPRKVFLSWKKVNERLLQRDIDMTVLDDDMKYGFQRLYELMEYVQDNGNPNHIIIDADDLLTNPRSIVSQYCNATGIPFSESMLSWPQTQGGEIFNTMLATKTTVVCNLMEGGFYDSVNKSTSFIPPLTPLEQLDIPSVILPLVEESMPYYEKMYAKRIKPY